MIDIFYKSYKKDFEWLYYSLKSIKKYLTGYNRIIIVIPKNEEHLFNYEETEGLNCIVHLVNEYGNGYLYQQLVKMQAHLYTKADYILYFDSDCIVTRPFDVNDYLINNKVRILYTSYSKVGDAICWKLPTENFIGEPQEYEFMRRIPLLFYRSTLEKIYNDYPNLENLIMKSSHFSEFNAIGAWAFKYEKDKYSFVNTDDWIYEEPAVKQYWSYGGLEKVLPEIKKILE